jgi:hypothetical protein
MTFCYIARMDERRTWLRRARRILSIWLLTCIIRDSDQEVMRGQKLTHDCYSNRTATVAATCYSNRPGSSRFFLFPPWPFLFLIAHPLQSPTTATPFFHGKTREEREIRVCRRSSTWFLFKNWSVFLSSLRFPSIDYLSSLFMVVPPCVMQLRWNRESLCDIRR